MKKQQTLRRSQSAMSFDLADWRPGRERVGIRGMLILHCLMLLLANVQSQREEMDKWDQRLLCPHLSQNAAL